MTWPDPPILVAIIAATGVGLGAWLTWLASGSSRLQARPLGDRCMVAYFVPMLAAADRAPRLATYITGGA